MTGYRCPLGALQPKKPDAERQKLEGWRDHGILVVSVDDERLNWMHREMVRQLGELLYGDIAPG